MNERIPDTPEPLGTAVPFVAAPTRSEHLPESGEAPSGASPDSAAWQRLQGELLALLAEARPLAASFLRLARAESSMLWFFVRESARLAAGRLVVWVFAVAMFLCAWIFFSMFLWRAAFAATGHSFFAPLALLVAHLAAGFALLAWKQRLKL